MSPGAALSGTLVRVRWPLHLLRGVLGIGMLSLFAFGLRDLPLAEAYSIFFIAPLLITVLSVPILGERVDSARWIAILVGLLGVIVVLRPTGSGMFTLAGLAVLVSAVCYSISAITVRIVGRTDSTESQLFWLMAMVGDRRRRHGRAWLGGDSRGRFLGAGRHRRLWISRPVGDHRSLPPWRGIGDRAPRIQRAGLGGWASTGSCGAPSRIATP